MPSSNGPQAQDDFITDKAGQVVLIDVMNNDNGGNAKHLVSVGKAGPAALAAPAAATTSTLGATVSIVGDKVSYAPTSEYLRGLPLGQTVVDTFSYTIQMGNGASSTAWRASWRISDASTRSRAASSPAFASAHGAVACTHSLPRATQAIARCRASCNR